MIFLALKTYENATGESAIQLLSKVKEISLQTNVPIIACAQAVDIYRIKKELDIEVWAQHVDPIIPGRNTGWISPYSVKQGGASGVLINHSEHKIPEDVVVKTVDLAKKYGLKTMVIAQNPDMVLKYDQLDIDYISFEKEELIASETSMIDEQEATIRQLVTKLKHPLIIGAGINDKEDIDKTIKAGARGVLLATYFVKATDPTAKLRELASGFSSK